MLREKKCKGTGKANGYGCGKLVPVQKYGQSNRVYGLGKSCGCYSNWLTSTEEGRKIIEKATLKVTKPRRELEEAEKIRQKEKSLPHLLINVRTWVHKYVKLRDKGLPCISCGVPYRESFQAGHCFAAGDYSTIRYFFNNIHGQCVGCNIAKNGNETEYLLRLPHRIGEDAVNELKSLADADRRTNHKWDRETLYKIRDEAKRLYYELKKT